MDPPGHTREQVEARLAAGRRQRYAVELATCSPDRSPLDRLTVYIEAGGRPGPPTEIMRWLVERAVARHGPRSAVGDEPASTPIYDGLLLERPGVYRRTRC